MITKFSGGDFLFGTALGTEYLASNWESGPSSKGFQIEAFPGRGSEQEKYFWNNLSLDCLKLLMLYDLISFKKFDSNKNFYRRNTQLNMFERKYPKMKGRKQKTLSGLEISIFLHTPQIFEMSRCCIQMSNYILSHLKNPNKNVVSWYIASRHQSMYSCQRCF